MSVMSGPQPCFDVAQLELLEHISLLQSQIDQLYSLYSTETQLHRAANAANVSLAAKLDHMRIQLFDAETKVDQLTAENDRLNLTLNQLVSRHRAFLERLSTRSRCQQVLLPSLGHARAQ